MNPVSTTENVADLFTKPLGHRQFWYLSQQALGDHVMDTHAYVILDLRRQQKRSNGGSVLQQREIRPKREEESSLAGHLREVKDRAEGKLVTMGHSNLLSTGALSCSVNGFYQGESE